MKLKITDVREVIGELITETWSPHDVHRPWKFPTPEERVRIEREMGMPLRWDAMLGSAKYDNFTEKWRTTRYGRIQPMIYYSVGVSVKDVNSTLDDGYGICTIAIAYDSPFGRPSEYWVAGYGPRPDMDELEKVMQKQMISNQSKVELIGPDRLQDWLKHENFKYKVSRLIYEMIVHEARYLKTQWQPGPNKPHSFQYAVRFVNKEDMQYVVHKATNDIKIAIHREFPDMKVQVHVDYAANSSVAEFSTLLFNKYTNYMMGTMPFGNVDIVTVKEIK